jgi:Protein of unknown function (DUF1552)
MLRGAGGVAVALPWLEVMTPERSSRATPAGPRRFLAVYQPGGCILERWTPAGTEDAFTLSPTLSPLELLKDSIVVLSGVDMKSALKGPQYSGGMQAWLTGTSRNGAYQTTYAKAPSIDQVLAGRISNEHAIASLNLAVRWGTGQCMGVAHPMDIVSYATDAAFSPVAPQLDPVAIWSNLVGRTQRDLAWDQSILDAVDRRYARLASRLGAADRQRLEQHLTRVRELERELSTAGSPRAGCAAPELVDTSDYDPASGLESPWNGSNDPQTDAAMPKVGKLMMDLMVMALACDLTSVGTLQWSDAECEYSLPWLGLDGTHKCYMNDCGYQPLECERISTWYYAQHAYLLGRMAEVDVGGRSLLDETVVFFGSDIQNPASYSKTDLPFLLAGGGEALRTGRWLRYDHVSHNDLLVSMLRLFGGSETTFGDPEHCAGPLPRLT